MEITRVRDFGDAELREEALKASEQLFRIRFQIKMGQTEGVKKLQTLRRDIARFKTVQRERALGIRGASAVAESSVPKRRSRLGKGKTAKEAS